MKKLVLFGDSLLAQINKTLTLELEEKVPNSIVYNCATSGFDTNDCLIRASSVARIGADYIIIALGTNDAAPWKQVQITKFKENLGKIVDIFQGQKIIFFLPPPVDEAKQAPDRKRISKTVTEYREAVRETLGSKVDYLNSDEFYGKLIDQDVEYHTDDGVHLNSVGYSVLFSELAKVIH